MAAKNRASSVADLNREIAELGASVRYLGAQVEAIRKMSEANAERIRWYDFWIKAGKVLAVVAAAVLTFKFGDVKALIFSTITK
jgi:hypothetical protein